MLTISCRLLLWLFAFESWSLLRFESVDCGWSLFLSKSLGQLLDELLRFRQGCYINVELDYSVCT